MTRSTLILPHVRYRWRIVVPLAVLVFLPAVPDVWAATYTCGKVTITEGSPDSIKNKYSCFTHPDANPDRCICDKVDALSDATTAASVTVASDTSHLLIKAWSWGGGPMTAPGFQLGSGGGSGFGAIDLQFPLVVPSPTPTPPTPRTFYFSLAHGYWLHLKPTAVKTVELDYSDHREVLLAVGGGGRGGSTDGVSPGGGGPGGGTTGGLGGTTVSGPCTYQGGFGGTASAGGAPGTGSGSPDCAAAHSAQGGAWDAVCVADGSLYQCSGAGWYSGGTGATQNNAHGGFGAGGAGGGSSFYRSTWPVGQPISWGNLLSGSGANPGNAGDPDRSRPNPNVGGPTTPPEGMGVGFVPGQGGHAETAGRIVFVWDNAATAPPPRGDMNGDGLNDLVLRNGVACPRSGSTWEHRFWLMNGASRFAEHPLAPTPGDSNCLSGVADFSGDGKPDLVFLDETTRAVEFWLMNGGTPPGRIGSPVPLTGQAALSSNWQLAATGEFDHDGKPDIVWRNTATQALSIWTMNGTVYKGAITPSPGAAVDGNWSVVGAVDLNGDHNTDLLWYNSTSGKIVYWWLDQDVVRIAGAFTTPDSAGNNNWKVVAVGDYGVIPPSPPHPGCTPAPCTGMVGTNDIVWRNETSGRFVIWYMDTFGVRTNGGFTNPMMPDSDPLDWTIVGPR